MLEEESAGGLLPLRRPAVCLGVLHVSGRDGSGVGGGTDSMKGRSASFPFREDRSFTGALAAGRRFIAGITFASLRLGGCLHSVRGGGWLWIKLFDDSKLDREKRPKTVQHCVVVSVERLKGDRLVSRPDPFLLPAIKAGLAEREGRQTPAGR